MVVMRASIGRSESPYVKEIASFRFPKKCAKKPYKTEVSGADTRIVQTKVVIKKASKPLPYTSTILSGAKKLFEPSKYYIEEPEDRIMNEAATDMANKPRTENWASAHTTTITVHVIKAI